MAAINQYIYVVGGFDGTRQLATVERYDTENETWDMVAPIQIARSALSLTPLDGKLYAIGGFDGNNFLSIVEVYDPRTNTWVKGTPLKSGRSGHASAVIYQPACATTFMDYEESEETRRDGSNDEGRSGDSSHDPCASRSPNYTSGAANMQFHTSFGMSGCNNCESELTVMQELTADSHNFQIPAINGEELINPSCPWARMQQRLRGTAPMSFNDSGNITSTDLTHKFDKARKKCILSTAAKVIHNHIEGRLRKLAATT